MSNHPHPVTASTRPTRGSRRLAATALAGAAVVALVACGNTGSSGGGSGSPSPTAAGAFTPPVIPTLASDSQPGPGVTDNSVKVGIGYTVNPDTLNHSGGITNADSGPQRDYAQAVIDDINAHGGLGGRTLVPVWHAYDATSTEPADQQDQAACADFTQDNHVFVVLGAQSDTMMKCTANSGAVMTDDNVSTFGADTFTKYPQFVELCCASLDRMASFEFSALKAQNYFTPWDAKTGKAGSAPVKVGILTFDGSEFKTPVNDVLMPAIRNAGDSVEASYVQEPQSAADLSAVVGDVKTALLKFKSDNVSHVIIFEASGTLSYFFYADAKQQGFFPRYGVNSGDASQLLIDGKKVGGDQLNGAVGFSWTPFSDIPAKQNADNGPYSNATRQKCVSVLRAKGIKFPSQNGEAVAILYCDELYFEQYVFSKIGSGPVNASTWVQAVNQLGAGFTSGDTFGTYLDGQHHDGAAYAYFYGYDAGCNCMQYTGDPVRIP